MNIIPVLPRPLPLMCACQWAWASLLLAVSIILASLLLSAAILAPGPSWPSLARRHRDCALTNVQESLLLTWPMTWPSSPSPPSQPLALPLAATKFSPMVLTREWRSLLLSPQGPTTKLSSFPNLSSLTSLTDSCAVKLSV